MWPRSIERGIRHEQDAAAADENCFNVAALDRARHLRALDPERTGFSWASMWPRSIERGIRGSSVDQRRCGGRFNVAALDRARNQVRAARGRAGAQCFNVAALDRARNL